MAAFHHLWNALISIPFILFVRTMVLTIPYSREGFFCQDDEIRYPLYEDTISSNAMYVLFWTSGIVLVVAVEWLLIRHLTRGQRSKLVRGEQKMHPGLFNILYFLISLSCSMLGTSTIVNLGKRTVSRLRPNFLAVCQPNLTQLCPPDTYRYVQDYVCYGRSSEDEYFAFPSGHAAQSINFAVFMIYYLQKRFKVPFLRAALQFLILLTTLFISLSRVRDHKHRLADVLGGATIGCLTGTFFMNYVLHHFKPNYYRIEDKTEEELLRERKVYRRRVIAPVIISMPTSPSTNREEQQQCSGGGAMTSAYGSCWENSSSENIYEPIGGGGGGKGTSA